MKQIVATALFLVGISPYCQAQWVLTTAVESRQPQTQHSTTRLIAQNRIAQQANVTYTAGESVTLLPGFVARAGSVFSASIRSQADQPVTDQLTVRAYPNPFRQETRVEYALPRSGPVRGVLTNLQGQVLRPPTNETWQEKGAHGLDLSVGDLPAGTYIYQLQTGSEQKTIRLIKQP